MPKALQKAAQQDDLLFFVPLGAAQVIDSSIVAVIAGAPCSGLRFTQAAILTVEPAITCQVWLQGLQGQLFVRRRTAVLPQDLQIGTAGSAEVDWVGSLQLNLVMQTTYELCTTACRWVALSPCSLKQWPFCRLAAL